MKLLANNATVTLEYDPKEEYPDIKLKIETHGRTIFNTVYASRSSKTEIGKIADYWDVIE